MTPLAHKVLRELTLPVKDRTFYDVCNITPRMGDVHCFDVSQISQLAWDMGLDQLKRVIAEEKKFGDDPAWRFLEPNEQMGFLPAPKTWLEDFVTDLGESPTIVLPRGERPAKLPMRRAYFLEELDRTFVRCTVVEDYPRPDGERDFGCPTSWRIALSGDPEFGRSLFEVDNFDQLQDVYEVTSQKDLEELRRYICNYTAEETFHVYVLLAMINSPRIIGRRQHLPHRGLERELLRNQSIIGHFPLHAWTEILLECSPTPNVAGEQDYEAHLTGRRCLHFCRAHLRLRMGQVEFVKSHWRGDASLGMKRSRYRLAAARGSA